MQKGLLRLEGTGAASAHTAAELLPGLYNELRHLAAAYLSHEKPGQTLQTTALVHEAWLRVEGSKAHPWDSKAHFFASAAEAMRRILVENARRKQALKRGDTTALTRHKALEVAAPVPDEQLLAVDEALEGLAKEDPEAAQLVKLRFFVGLTHREAAEVMGLKHCQADQTWLFAKAWLAQVLKKI